MIISADLAGSRIAFYATVATVIPVIMLAVSFQMRADTLMMTYLGVRGPLTKKWTITALVVLGLLLVLLLSGEIDSLLSLEDGRNVFRPLVWAAVWDGLFLLFAGVTDRASTQIKERYESDAPGGQLQKMTESAVQKAFEHHVNEIAARAVKERMEQTGTTSNAHDE